MLVGLPSPSAFHIPVQLPWHIWQLAGQLALPIAIFCSVSLPNLFTFTSATVRKPRSWKSDASRMFGTSPKASLTNGPHGKNQGISTDHHAGWTQHVSSCRFISDHLHRLLLEFSALHRTHGGRSSGNVCSSKRLAKNPTHSKWFKMRNNLWAEVFWSRIWVDLPEFNNKHWAQNFTSPTETQEGRKGTGGAHFISPPTPNLWDTSLHVRHFNDTSATAAHCRLLPFWSHAGFQGNHHICHVESMD